MQNSTVTSSSAANPFFPASPLSPRPAAPSDADRPRSCRVRPSSHSLADPRFRPSHAHPRTCEASTSSNFGADGNDDSESLDSIVLDESPCPLRLATPGGALRAGAFGGAFGAPSLDSMPSSPSSAAPGYAANELPLDADAGSDVRSMYTCSCSQTSVGTAHSTLPCDMVFMAVAFTICCQSCRVPGVPRCVLSVTSYPEACHGAVHRVGTGGSRSAAFRTCHSGCLQAILTDLRMKVVQVGLSSSIKLSV